MTRIWHDSWQEAHAEILPLELACHRTCESLIERLSEAIGSIRIIELSGGISGFSMFKGNELYLFYLSGKAHGIGGAWR